MNRLVRSSIMLLRSRAVYKSLHLCAITSCQDALLRKAQQMHVWAHFLRKQDAEARIMYGARVSLNTA